MTYLIGVLAAFILTPVIVFLYAYIRKNVENKKPRGITRSELLLCLILPLLSWVAVFAGLIIIVVMIAIIIICSDWWNTEV